MLKSINITINGKEVKKVKVQEGKAEKTIVVNIDGDIFNNVNKYREFKEGLKILLEKYY